MGRQSSHLMHQVTKIFNSKATNQAKRKRKKLTNKKLMHQQKQRKQTSKRMQIRISASLQCHLYASMPVKKA
ncbi:hypothetical protein UZ38_34305, partial [Bacillus amyloliquefaciens]